VLANREQWIWRPVDQATRIALLALSLVVLGPAIVLAQGTEPGSTLSARAIYLEGQALFQAGKTREALARFQQVLKLASRPSILLGIAQCHRLLAEFKLAKFYYETYLRDWSKLHPGRTAPYADDVAKQLTLIPGLIKAQEDEQQRAAEQRTRAEQERARVQQATLEARRRQDRSKQQDEERRQAQAIEGQRRTRSLWGYTALGLGAACVVTASALLGVGIAKGNDAHDSYHKSTTDDEFLRSRGEIQAAERKLTAAYVLYGVGAAALGAAVYFLVTRPKAETSSRFSSSIAPSIDKTGLGLTIRGLF
jgi:TolA-binding protein